MGQERSINDVLNGITFIQKQLSDLSPEVHPSQEEINDISAAGNKLWELDFNRLVPGEEYAINVQRGKKIYHDNDAARDPLFTYVDAKVFERPTYKAFLALLDNYTSATGVREVVTVEEEQENFAFLKLIMETPVMKYCHNYLVATGKAPRDKEDFMRFLNDLWFGLYRRTTTNDSSGFEHVFLGEIKDGEVTGMHNWVQLYEEEKRRNLDYRGFIYPKRVPGVKGSRLPTDEHQLITIQFIWNGCLKKCSSSFIGTSPEFEIALYTMCFFTGGDKDNLKCGPYNVEVTCYKYTFRGKTHIGTSFPSEAPLSSDEAATRIQSSYRGRATRKSRSN